MGNIETVKIKKLGDNKNVDLELDTTTIEKFVTVIDEETLSKLEKYMGNKEDYEEEYIVLDEDYSFLDAADISSNHLLNLSDFFEYQETIQNKDGEEVCTGFLNIPKEGEFKCIIVNTKTDSYALISESDAVAVIKGIYNSDHNDMKKVKSSTKEIVEKLEEGLVIDEDDNITSLDEVQLQEDELEDNNEDNNNDFTR